MHTQIGMHSHTQGKECKDRYPHFEFYASREDYDAACTQIPLQVASTVFTTVGHRDCDVRFDKDYLVYKTMAFVLRNSTPATKLRDQLFSFYREEWRDRTATDPLNQRYFFGVAAPSGSGKTQTAFTLKTFDGLNVIHTVLSIDKREGRVYTEDMQPIYRHGCIIAPSFYLNEAISWDFDEISNLPLPVSSDATWTPAAEDLLPGGPCQKWQLHTVMALSRMFNLLDADNKPIAVVEALRFKLWECVGANDGSFRLPVLVVDEAQFYKDPVSGRRRLFLCAVLRAVGIASIFLGTNFDIVKPLSVRTYSKPGAVPTPWAHLVTALPRPYCTASQLSMLAQVGNVDSIKFLRALTEYASTYTNSVQCFNPLFSYRLWEYFLKDPARTIDELRSEAAQHLYGEKCLLRTAAGISAQLLYCLGEAPALKEDIFMHCHFARLEEEVDLDLTPFNQVVIKDTNIEWVPQLAFASPAVDPIGPLLLGGVCTSHFHPPPFEFFNGVSAVRLTAAMAVQLHRERVKCTSVGSDISDDTASDKQLEMVMAVAAVCASKARSITGALTVTFLLHFATELLLHAPKHPLHWDPTTPLKMWWRGADRVIPFCSGVSTETYPTSILPNIGRYERHAHRGGREGVQGMLRDSNQTALCTFESVPIAIDESGDGQGGSVFLNTAVRNFISTNAPLGVIIVPCLTGSVECDAHIGTDVHVVKMVVHQAEGTMSIEALRSDDRTGEVAIVPRTRIVCVFYCG